MHVLLAPGASGGPAAIEPYLEGLRARGMETTAVRLPLRKAELAVSPYREQALACATPARARAVGGQSYGGRVASLLAAQEPGICGALLCIAYPLHRPGAPAWCERSAHWPTIGVPALFLSGESDPFARVDLLQRAVGERLPHAQLVTFPRVSHSLRPVLDEVLEVMVSFLRPLGEVAPEQA